MSSRIQTLDQVFTTALNDGTLSLAGVAKVVHRDVPEVKQVAVVKETNGNNITFSVLFHDRERLSITLHRAEKVNEK